MADEPVGFTVYLEGHDGHRGNVLAHVFTAKVQRLIIVLARLERAFNGEGNRKTDFEIIAATKTNPTTLSLKPVPKAKAYDPAPAFEWGMGQIAIVSKGGVPDQRVRGEIANDLVKLALKESEDGYKNFWINGYAENVRFDEAFLAHARQIARVRALEDAPSRWHTGAARGSIVGELKKVDDLDATQEFVIVPRTGPETITCKFPDALREKIGSYLFKIVRVSGKLHYGETSPFPYRVDVDENGIEDYPARQPRRTLSEMRGIFSESEKPTVEWDSLLNV